MCVSRSVTVALLFSADWRVGLKQAPLCGTNDFISNHHLAFISVLDFFKTIITMSFLLNVQFSHFYALFIPFSTHWYLPLVITPLIRSSYASFHFDTVELSQCCCYTNLKVLNELRPSVQYMLWEKRESWYLEYSQGHVRGDGRMEARPPHS